MSELQLSEFKEWFTKKYTYSAEYFALAHFDVDRGFFTANDMYNPDASNAAWVLRASFDAWKHQQAIIDDLKAQLNNMETCYIEKKKGLEELQGQVSEALEEIQRALNCCESTETACVLGELVKVLRGAND